MSFRLAGGLAVLLLCASAVQTQASVGSIRGVVQGAQGPEAGAWVIAETRDLATNFIMIVVSDDQGRFLLPELPPRTTRSGRAGLKRRTPIEPSRS